MPAWKDLFVLRGTRICRRRFTRGTIQRSETMRKLLTAAVVVAFATPALAQDFYVVQDSSTKRCEIVQQRPTTTTTTVVGDGVFKTRVEAENAMKTVKVCEGGASTGTSTTTTITR
jgi:hypothetical protein